MKSIGKYLIGMAAGAALVGGAGIAYSERGAAKWEPCRMTAPPAGVTQLCELDGAMAVATGNGGGSANAAGGGGPDSVTVITNNNGFDIGFPGPGTFPSQAPDGGGQLPSLSLPAIAAPPVSLPSTPAPAVAIPPGPGVALPSAPAVSLPLPGGLIPGAPIFPDLPAAVLPGTSLPSIQIGANGTTDAASAGAGVVLGDPNGTPALNVNVTGAVDTSAALLGPPVHGAGEPVGITVNAAAGQTNGTSGGANATLTASAATANQTPLVKVNATAAPGTATGTNGLSVDVGANTGGEPGVSAAVTGDAGTGASAATGVSADAAVSTGGTGGTSIDVTAGVTSSGGGGITASVSGGGVNAGIGGANIGIGTDPGGSSGSGGTAGIAGLSLY